MGKIYSPRMLQTTGIQQEIYMFAMIHEFTKEKKKERSIITVIQMQEIKGTVSLISILFASHHKKFWILNISTHVLNESKQGIERLKYLIMQNIGSTNITNQDFFFILPACLHTLFSAWTSYCIYITTSLHPTLHQNQCFVFQTFP